MKAIAPRSKWILALRLLLLLGLVCSALFSAGRYLQSQASAWNPLNLSDDPVTNWESRCEALKEDLPPRGTVSYLSEWDLPGWSGGLSDMDNEFRLTQFALVPRIVVRGTGSDLVIGNFSSAEGAAAAEKQYSLRQVHSYGLGIYLFEKAPPP